jgi:ferredoxin
MKVHVDSTACVGHGQCAANAPDVFTLDGLGYAEEPAGDVPPQLAEEAKRGAGACRERAITLK